VITDFILENYQVIYTCVFTFPDCVIHITHFLELAQIDGLHFSFYNCISNSRSTL